MAALLQADRVRERLVRGFVAPDALVSGRRFRLVGDVLEPAEGAPDGKADLVAVPTEQVLLLEVELPLATRRARLEALPFAIEDRIADPLDAVHVALGPEIAPQTYLAAVVRHETMRAWIAAVEASPAPAAALVPDALLLPMPAAGQWAVAVAGVRALVRSGDRTGFAIAPSQLPLAWEAGGRPPVTAWSGGVPAALGALPGDPALLGPEGGMPPIDLRQGGYAYRRPAMSVLRRRVLTVAVAGILAHAAIAAIDTLALRHQAHARAVQTRALIAAALPGVGDGDDIVSAVAARLPVAGHGGAPDPLLPLLARVSAAAGPVALNGIEYDLQGGRLVLAVASGSETRLAALLAAAGLRAVPGAGSVVVRGAGA